jgi:hypothetical protein
MLLVESDRTTLPNASTPYKITWAASVQSVHLTLDGSSCEFDPNSDVMDPHVDAFWDADAIWANVTQAYKTMGAGLGWFGRPCQEVLTPSNTSATIVPVSASPKKQWKVMAGECVSWDNLTDAQVGRVVERFKGLIDRGVRAWYWDSFGCYGRLRVARAIKAYVQRSHSDAPRTHKHTHTHTRTHTHTYTYTRTFFVVRVSFLHPCPLISAFFSTFNYLCTRNWTRSCVMPTTSTTTTATTKRYCPECFIMREGETDIDALLISQFPWYSNQGPYEPDNTHLGRLVLPNAEIFFGELASPPPLNFTIAALKQVSGG